jgi:hypothetical protein
MFYGSDTGYFSHHARLNINCEIQGPDSRRHVFAPLPSVVPELLVNQLFTQPPELLGLNRTGRPRFDVVNERISNLAVLKIRAVMLCSKSAHAHPFPPRNIKHLPFKSGENAATIIVAAPSAGVTTFISVSQPSKLPSDFSTVSVQRQ